MCCKLGMLVFTPQTNLWGLKVKKDLSNLGTVPYCTEWHTVAWRLARTNWLIGLPHRYCTVRSSQYRILSARWITVSAAIAEDVSVFQTSYYRPCGMNDEVLNGWESPLIKFSLCIFHWLTLEHKRRPRLSKANTHFLSATERASSIA